MLVEVESRVVIVETDSLIIAEVGSRQTVLTWNDASISRCLYIYIYIYRKVKRENDCVDGM